MCAVFGQDHAQSPQSHSTMRFNLIASCSALLRAAAPRRDRAAKLEPLEQESALGPALSAAHAHAARTGQIAAAFAFEHAGIALRAAAARTFRAGGKPDQHTRLPVIGVATLPFWRRRAAACGRSGPSEAALTKLNRQACVKGMRRTALLARGGEGRPALAWRGDGTPRMGEGCGCRAFSGPRGYRC